MSQNYEICFYETDKAYGCFSNFSKHVIELEGVSWPTSEHFFQGQKFTNRSDIDAVLNAPTPFVAARIGRELERSCRQDWEAVRDDVMLRVLEAKFTQHADLSDILLSTHGVRLVEHTRNDRYWGDGGDGTGRNMLGQLLEKVRTHLGSTALIWCPPPWVQAPDIDPSDMYWRMGRGEDQLTQAERFRNGLSPVARKHYDMYFPTPELWCRSW
ncbi:MAG: NADAR family protein [Pseudomonadota bacterium]